MGDLPLPMQGGNFPSLYRWNHRSLKLSCRLLSGDGEEGERGLGVSNSLIFHLMGGDIKFWMPVEAKASSWNSMMAAPLGQTWSVNSDHWGRSYSGETGRRADYPPTHLHLLRHPTVL